MEHDIVGRDAWLEARKALLAKEKAFNETRDALSRARRELPWVRIEKPYVFDGPNGAHTLGELFAGRSQLVVYHFMFAPEWDAGCKSCTFWADNFERNVVHLAHRDVTLVAVSRAPIAKLAAYRKRLGWTFDWYSSGQTDFNYDFAASFDPKDENATYNYRPKTSGATDLPGISVFYRDPKDPSGDVFHTYSTYSRGIDMMNAAYHYLDLVPNGRDEAGGIMEWLRRRDEYETRA